MKSKILIIVTFLFILISCSKNDAEVEIPQNINGNYVGFFERNGVSSNVQLNLTNGTFNGQSTTLKFPALCNGTYIITSNTITFEDKCMWTAEFDWTLILNGEWNYIMNGNNLTLTKANGDKYVLSQ
ncbi:hypothetical protein JE945_002472 [Flavobacterium psychrophilum]|uniref:Lipoprotein n=1 Tax=Flavobacterium psychrophilum TaxID=96345 RepID=A0A7U2NGG0_FLAPS|nr:hypothetical protein [Flavobacterium psychrophilum]EKT4520703.1 hypothetical protein [Flavobacterium psychrophilum]EKT4553279.1 hypothetical protein [Flavobacterium psychrophilum]QRE04735.1 hypothetical protein H0H26_03830 [Flavobacterium psychrophilum]